MIRDLRMTQHDWKVLRKHFRSSFRRPGAPETGALGILGERTTPTRREFTVARILLPGPGDLKTATSGALTFAGAFIRKAHLAMRQSSLSGIATFHTHPGATDHVSFSPYDDHEDPQLFSNLIELEPTTTLVSVVAGENSQCGRVFTAAGSPEALGRLILIGDRLTTLSLTGDPPPPPPPAAEIFDRGLALTGSGALAQLSRMTVAVVGASGTGSLICEMLARAGCRSILLIDHDIVRLINLNRILHATREDARCGTPKVIVLERAIREMELGCCVEPIQGSILDAEVLRRVLDADLVFGCVDSALPRHLLCKLSAQYLLPYIDVGTEIGGDERGIVSLDSRATYVTPGRQCLKCVGVVTARQLEFESLSYAERKRKIALGYSDDLVIEKPAVMDLNMRAASRGMLLLRHLLQPFLLEPLPVSISDNAVTYRTIPISKARNLDPVCPTCVNNPNFGFGDCGAQIGFDSDTVCAIMGPEACALAGVMRLDFQDAHRNNAPHFLQRIGASLGKFRGLFQRRRG